jgi:catechol 2,3-dioxygenase-like lactoylglutathione lyase family enzyme
MTGFCKQLEFFFKQQNNPMQKRHFIIAGFLTSFATGIYFTKVFTQNPSLDKRESIDSQKPNNMKLGAFSISLSVKDLKTSKEFYEKLGFTAFAGSMKESYLIMKNENALIGLFQGMFQGNILTFNPGWDESAKNIESFDDIREIQKLLKSSGVPLTSEADDNTKGPASLTLTDPDGNIILIDQHR